MTLPKCLVSGALIASVLFCAADLAAQEHATRDGEPVARKAKPTTRKAKATTTRARPRLPKGFVPKTIKQPDGVQRKYLVFVPPQYVVDKTAKWPVVVFLHGSGECGEDGVKQTKFGLPSLIARYPFKFPFIAVMPQAHTLWFRGEDAAAVWAILEAVHEEYRTDRDRVYLTGQSMGGFATWELAITRPDVFAAIVPVCGQAPMEFVSNVVHLPVWAFHGAKDPNVPVGGSRDPIAELRRLGADPMYTEYPNMGHACWDLAYGTPKLWDWLLAQRRQPPPRAIDYRLPGGSTVVWWLGVQAEDGLKEPAHIHAEVGEDGRVTVRSEGVAGWLIKSETYPLKTGDQIDVTWNGEHVYKGEFTGGLAVKPNRE
ncbi:MAG: prolyl oligopeptidase family serine peptidase [Phycisphaerae bacterium]|nr:prolyl oligopeptidase family serine peptidase [Phycisphaerae bacterium]